MSSKIPLALVGFGLVGKRHADAIARSDEAHLIAIADNDPKRRKEADEFGVPCFDSLEALFEKAAPAGVILATPTKQHTDHGLICVRHGCPMLVEKPIAADSASASKLVEAAERAKCPVLVGHHRRHNPVIQEAKAIIESGRLGDIRAVHAQCWFYKPDDYFEVGPWRKLKGAGPVSVNLAHDIDLLRHFCGEVEAVQAVGIPSKRGFENEDVCAVILRFKNDIAATVSVSDSIAAPWSWEMTAEENPVYPVTDQFCYLVGGARASLSIPDLKIWAHEKEPDWWSPIEATAIEREKTDPLVRQIDQFAKVVKGEEEPLVSGREGLETLKIIEAIHRAAEHGAIIAP